MSTGRVPHQPGWAGPGLPDALHDAGPGLPDALHDAGPVLSLTVQRKGLDLTIEACGELDMSNVHLLEELVTMLVGEPSPRVALDLSGIRFFDAHGISALLRIRQHVGGARGILEVRNPTPQVRYLLTLAGVAGYLDVAEHPAARIAGARSAAHSPPVPG